MFGLAACPRSLLLSNYGQGVVLEVSTVEKPRLFLTAAHSFPCQAICQPQEKVSSDDHTARLVKATELC